MPKEFNTIYVPGVLTSQTQITKYTGQKMVRASTEEDMYAIQKNNLAPLDVMPHPWIGQETPDVDLQPFSSWCSLLNPVKITGAAVSWALNWRNGVEIIPATSPSPQSVAFHAPIPSKISIGQEIDIEAIHNNVQLWRNSEDRKPVLVLQGSSRGTAGIVCASARYQYPELGLIILEGAIDSVENVFHSWAKSIIGPGLFARGAAYGINTLISGITAWRPDGPSPLNHLEEYPENVPTVFVTSKNDRIVPPENTRNIANKLAERGKNDVWLLELEHSDHRNYTYHNAEDRDKYESFLHAIYRRYDLEHQPHLADRGEDFLEECLLYAVEPVANQVNSRHNKF